MNGPNVLAEALDRPLSPPELANCERYLELLLEWNQAMNLVGETAPEALWHKHLVDCLLYARAVGHPASLVDVGSGNGMPGLVLGCVLPGTRVVLVESLVKRCTFLSEAARLLGLDNVEVVCARAEEIGQMPEHREVYHVATARRVAELAILCEYCLPLLAPGGRAVLAKGVDWEAEVAGAQGVPELLGGRFAPTIELPAPAASVAVGEPEVRRYVVVDKVEPTPQAYPRRPGRATKKPLRAAT
ncbi:MAG: 16S rRNA (guanine(527)-N(7))-methyltransferase RsmG [Armatimonadetes bacterium]|nr:16S rRNA (guanine(527)-N(7))-methyltransferase RsmG [Armatimonadota bacterium]